jgi:hypothetical protein
MRATSNILALAIAAILLLSITPTTTIYDGYDSDGRFYAAMSGAEGIEGIDQTTIDTLSPWNQRVLIPWLVSVLPFHARTGFLFVNQLANLLTLILLFFILKHFVSNKLVIFFTLLIYATVFWTIQFSLFSPFYIDSATMMFVCLIILLTIKRIVFLLVPTIIISSLAKESLAILIIFSAYHLYLKDFPFREISLRAILKSLALVIIPAILILVIRKLLQVQTDPSALLMPGWQFISFFKNLDSPLVLLQSIFSGTGVFLILIFINWRFSLKWLKANPQWLVYLGLCIYMLFGGHDKARLFLPLLPLLAIIFAKTISQVEEKNSQGKFLATINILFFANVIFGGLLFGLENTDTYLAKLVPEHSGGSYLPYLLINIGVSMAILLYFWVSKTRLANIDPFVSSRSEHTSNPL